MTSKVYYNSACPVCNAGIKDQRRRMEACGIKDIQWIDVHAHPEAVEEIGAPLEQVRERLHVRSADGQLSVGADAFARSVVTDAGSALVGSIIAFTGIQATYAIGVQFVRPPAVSLEPCKETLVIFMPDQVV